MADNRNMLVPAIVSFNLDGKELLITNYDLNIAIFNGCSYQETVAAHNGKRDYLLCKGSEIDQQGSITIYVVKTPDGKFDNTIKALREAREQTSKEQDPTKYAKPVLFSLCSNDKAPFCNISFTGYVSEVVEDTESAGFLVYKATIVIYDTASLQIKK